MLERLLKKKIVILIDIMRHVEVCKIDKLERKDHLEKASRSKNGMKMETLIQLGKCKSLFFNTFFGKSNI